MKLTSLQQPFKDDQEKTLEQLEKVIHSGEKSVYKSIKGISEKYNDKYNGEVLSGTARKALNKDIAKTTVPMLTATTIAMDKALTETLQGIYSGYSYSYAKISNSYLDYKALTPAQMKVIKLDKIQGKTYIDRLDFHSKNLNKTVSAAIQNGIRTGKSNQDIAKMIAKRVNVSEGHALTIAKTETARMGSIATVKARESAEAQGLLLTITWLHYGSNQPREDHIEMDRVKIKTGEHFTLPNGETCPEPRIGLSAGETVNCYCSTAESFEGFDDETKRRQGSKIVDVGSYDHWRKSNQD